MKRLHCSSVGAQQEVQRDGGHPHHKGRRWRGDVTPKQMEGRVAQGEGCRALVVFWYCCGSLCIYISVFKYVLPVFAVVFIVIPVSSYF